MYGLEDPAVDEVSVFTNPELQELYNQLIEKASNSVVDAILMGALIEEKDMIDIMAWINKTDNPDIIQVYENLMAGSENHLRAFASLYTQYTGDEYRAQLLDQATVDEILGEEGGRARRPHGPGPWNNGGSG